MPEARPSTAVHPRRQLVRMERLGKVVVRPEVEAHRLVSRRVHCGEEDDRHGPPFLEPAHDLDAVEVGHDDVEQDDIGAHLLGLLERLAPAVRGDDREAVLTQNQRHQPCDAGLIVCDEDERLCPQDHLQSRHDDGWPVTPVPPLRAESLQARASRTPSPIGSLQRSDPPHPGLGLAWRAVVRPRKLTHPTQSPRPVRWPPPCQAPPSPCQVPRSIRGSARRRRPRWHAT